MVWTVLSLTLVVLETSEARRARAGGWRREDATQGRWRRLLLLAYGLSATALYFNNGFEVFVMLYGLSVCALAALAAAALLRGASTPASALPRRLLRLACGLYGGGFVCLWAPGELLCRHVPLMQRLPMHALFHLTSAAAPHLGLTAFALARHEHERPTAPSSLWFAGMPAIDRGAALLDKAV